MPKLNTLPMLIKLISGLYEKPRQELLEEASLDQELGNFVIQPSKANPEEAD